MNENQGVQMCPTNEQIIEIIQNYQSLIAKFEIQKKIIIDEYAKLDENVYTYASFTSMDYEKGGYGGNISDLLEVIKRMEKKECEYRKDIEEMLQELLQNISFIRRVHLCYMALPYEQYELLKSLYEERISWGKLSEKLQMSISTISRKRCRALKMIQIVCESELSNKEILHLPKMYKGMTWNTVLQVYIKNRRNGKSCMNEE